MATEDRVVAPADHHEKLIVALPETRAVDIIGAGHSPHHTRTDEVVSAIEAYLSELN